MGIKVQLSAGDYLGAFARHQTLVERRIEYAALKATHRAAEMVKSRVRQDMSAAGLGRLGQALGSTSDFRKGQVYREAGGWSASGVVYVRSKSERTVGAIEAYTRGANIRPVKSPWLWIPTDNIQRMVGRGKDRRRLTPSLWKSSGLESRIGPLEMIKSVNGYPLLVVKTGAVAMTGKARSLRGRLKSGRAPKGFQNRDFIVAFIGIPFTSRTARVSISRIAREVMTQLPRLYAEALREG
ncbi:MAG: hypothetical protein IPG83_02455 [Novosphingobium sp.]|nr:hypothetical protein [Novosphingobium sp.]